MPEFKQTVNLKDNLEKKAQPEPRTAPVFKTERTPIAKRPLPETPTNKAKEIDKLFAPDETVSKPQASAQNEFKHINQPKHRQEMDAKTMRAVAGVAIIAVLLLGYFFFHRNRPTASTNDNTPEKWYMVKLVNGETFYGKIGNVSADPVVINNIYYNYDQAKDKADAQPETQNLRLVKRGKETYGPDGSLNVVRSQVMYMEPLRDDSKVLKAIDDYEKSK